MKEGYVRCPLCSRPVQVSVNGFLKDHWATLSRVGFGFRGNAERCKGSHKNLGELK